MAVEPDRSRTRFEEIYHAYGGSILAYAARRTQNPEDAADVVAETFSVAWRRIDSVPEGEQARAWLYGVARRTLANHHRGDRRRRGLYERLAAEGVAVAAPADTGLDREPIAAAFAALSDSDRELLTLVAWDGLGYDEVAAVLGCTRAGVRVRLHRARKRFERHLAAADPQRAATTGHHHGSWAPARIEQGEA